MNEPQKTGESSGALVLTTEDFYSTRQVSAATGRQIVCFQLSDQWYAVDITHVHEVLRIGQIITLPNAPPAIVGICQVRGAILSVTDPKKMFNLEPRLLTGQSRIIFIKAGLLETGLLVDAVSRVVEVTDECIEPPLSTIDQLEAGLLVGSCRVEGMVVTLIRVEALIARSRGAAESVGMAQ
ncbi:MAG: purine-binding chemotaxis protein CheW [Nitrospirae bacterium]|nr:purine-binding chemotaxis protein CheW [Nitrospirota bacterium]